MTLDGWLELFDRLNRNRFRTALTMISVAWGILMLVLLLGAGKGLENNIAWMFRDDATNSIWVRAGRTSMPYKGYGVGRTVRLTNADHDAIADLPGVEHITSRFHLWGDGTISYKDKHGAFDVRSCHPGHQFAEQTLIKEGRFLDDLDLAEKRKVAVIGVEVASFLFGHEPPLGQWINIKGIQYRVVGIFQDVGGPGEERKVYIPITTAQTAYGGGDRVHQIIFTVGDATLAESKALEEAVRELLVKQHDLNPDDRRALRVSNNLEEFQQIMDIFVWLRRFIWLVGMGTVLAGIVGVSNIMLVSVKERTSELGLRKALGATPLSVVGMILQEAVLLTGVAGYSGLVTGILIIEAVDRYVPENDYIRHPSVDLGVVFGATALLVIFGTLAGLFPAMRAAAINPIDALRDE